MRILGITIPEQKQIAYGLTSIYGIGLSRSRKLLEELSIDPIIKVKDIDQAQEAIIRKVVEACLLEGDLRRDYASNIKRLKDVGSYRGSRHAHSLPVRGQRTKTNSRTSRGNKRLTMGSGRRKVEKT